MCVFPGAALHTCKGRAGLPQSSACGLALSPGGPGPNSLPGPPAGSHFPWSHFQGSEDTSVGTVRGSRAATSVVVTDVGTGMGTGRHGDRHRDRQTWGRAHVGTGSWSLLADWQASCTRLLPLDCPSSSRSFLYLQWPCVCVSAHARVHASVHIQGARVGERTAWVSALLWARASRPSSSQASAVSSPPHRCVGSHLCSSTPGFREF